MDRQMYPSSLQVASGQVASGSESLQAESPAYLVHDLSVEAKRLMESLLGRPLGDAERVVVRAYAGEESAGQGGTAAENWERLLATQSAWRERVVAVPEEELDAAMAEALDAVRSGWRP